MKVILPVLLLFGFLARTPALPAISKSVADDVELVPPIREHSYGELPVVDTGILGFGNPFSGLFENVEGLMARMRAQMEALLRRFPGVQGSNATDSFPDFSAEGGFPGVPSFAEIDLSKGNTTSVTKIIDGHKVVINETEYKKEDDFGGSYFKVRIVDVKPDGSETTTEQDVERVTPSQPAIKDRESVENTIENEIPKSSEEVNYQNLEPFDEVDAFESISSNLHSNLQYKNTEWDDLSGVEPIDDNSINFQPIDLSRDTYVNEILANAGAPQNPDAEVIVDNRPAFTQANTFQFPR